MKMTRFRSHQSPAQGQAHLQFTQSQPKNLKLQKSLPFINPHNNKLPSNTTQ